jgi:hypothetical protein
MRYGYASGVVWWFVPIAVWWMPLKVFQETWRASDPSVAVGDGRMWRLKPGSPLAVGWWLSFVLCRFLFWLAVVMLVFGMTTILSPLAFLIIAFAGMIGVDVMQAELVRRLALRQATLFNKRMLAADKAAAAGEPVRDAQAINVAPEAAPLN